MSNPLRERRTLLEELELSGPAWHTPPWFTDGEALWEVVCEQGLEGVVAKGLDSLYRPGERRGWLKVNNADYWRRPSRSKRFMSPAAATSSRSTPAAASTPTPSGGRPREVEGPLHRHPDRRARSDLRRPELQLQLCRRQLDPARLQPKSRRRLSACQPSSCATMSASRPGRNP